MKIDQISQAFGIEIQKASGNTKNIEKSDKGTKADSVSLSKKAQELSQSSDTEAVARHIKNIPDVRIEKVQMAKAKVASGFYETPEFIDKLSEKLIKDFGISA